MADTESLLNAGLIDSTGVLELVAFLEGEFGIHLADAEIVPANLDSVRAIVAFVERYNHVRYHETINDLTPADVYFGRAETIRGCPGVLLNF